MFGLGHIDLTPVVYGVIMFLGLWSMKRKWDTHNYRGFLIEAGVFVLVFWLHGGTMNGGFSAMICALIAGTFLGRPKRPRA